MKSTLQDLAQETRFDLLANLPFAEGRPTPTTAQTLRDELLFERATQTYLWALPLINTLGMQVGSEKAFGAGYNVLPILEEAARCQDAGDHTELRRVIRDELRRPRQGRPAGDERAGWPEGILLDYWQRPIPVDGGKFFGDVGFYGPDGGKGGTFLLLPPNYKGTVPDGYYVYRSATNSVFIFLRGFYEDPKNLTPVVEHLEQTKIYPLNGQAGAKAMKFPDASGVPVNMLPISDGSVFDQLKRLVDREGDHLAGPDWLGMLAALGVVKGQPFTPDAHTREILDRAAKTGYNTSRVIGFEETFNGGSLRVYEDRRCWLNPTDNMTPPSPRTTMDILTWMNVAGGYRELDARIWFFTDYYSVSPGMVSKIPGKGAAYMMGFTDSGGAPLLGASHYRITLPPKVPAANFWSVTVYDASNASGLANGQAFPSLGSRDKPAQNGDGSTDVYLGPKAPEGKAGNWLATVPGKGYFAVLPLYGPTEAALDRSWKPGDIVKTK